MELDDGLFVASDPRVYPPSEDTFLLLAALQVPPRASCLELGTGSGLIALHMARRAPCLATDVNPWALVLARDNARRNGIPLHFVRTCLFQGLRPGFDVIAFNPPYLPHEGPREWIDRSWNGGPTGEEVLLSFLREARGFLRPRGRIFLVLSSWNSRSTEFIEDSYGHREVGRLKLDFEALTVQELW